MPIGHALWIVANHPMEVKTSALSSEGQLGVCAIEDSTGCVVVAGSEAIAPSDGQVI